MAAIDYLFKRNDYKDAPRPDLIILDLNLPKKDGREVLAEVKADEDLNTKPRRIDHILPVKLRLSY